MQFAGPRILVVDDEVNILLSVQAILRQEGFEVDACDRGAKAIEAIRNRHYDLVLTDLKMPGVDGLAVLAEVRKRSPNAVTVVMTGYASVDSAVDALQLGAYEYLLKPIGVPELKAAVHRALERKRFSEIDTLYRINRTLTSQLDPDAIAAEVCDAIKSVLCVANACLLRFDRQNGSIQQCGPTATSEMNGEIRRELLNEEIQSQLRNGAILTSDESGGMGLALRAGVQAFALLPGIAGERLVCALWADNGTSPYEFHASALRFLNALASQTAMALDNAALVAELKKSNCEMAAANKKLRDFDKLKSQFLSVATHELRTPLSVIMGYNTMLAESLEDRLTPDEQDTLRESVAACKRLVRLVNSMLDITQIESGKMKMSLAPTDLRSIISGVHSLLQHEAAKKDIRLQLQLPSRLPKVNVDSERMQQVLINLTANALKFTGAGGWVRISAHVSSGLDVIEVAVSDNGIGIDEEDQARIFDEFAQIQKQAALRHREGSGLGLSIAKRIVEAHNGTIRLESYPGQGSTFTFTVPLQARPEVTSTTAMTA